MAEAAEAAEVCLINIGPKQRRRRLRFGIALFAVSVGVAAALLLNDASRLSRLWLMLPLFAAGLGFFQWREKT